jgi:hypothetical protein
MRFSDLKIGDHFIFEGREYTKSSPVLAADDKGNSRFIPRSAVLQTYSDQHPHAEPIEATQLDKLYHAVLAIIRQDVRDGDLEVKLRHAIEKVWHSIRNSTD